MAAAVMKHMASNFSKLDKFEEVDFKRWQMKMHFLFFSTSVVYVLTTLILKDGGDDATMEQIRKSAKWDNDDYVCTGLILNDEAIQVSCIIDKLSPFWKDLKHALKHLKEELTLVELGSHLRIEESLKVHDIDKLKGNNVVGPLVVNMMEHNNSFRYKDNKCKCKHHDNGLILTRRLNVLVGNVAKLTTLKGIAKDDDVAWRVDSGATIHGVWGCRTVVRLIDPKLKTLGDRDIECIFVRYAEYSKDFRFYVVKPNDSVLINSIIESRDSIFDENRFSSVPRPNLRIPNRTEDIFGLVVIEEVTEEDDPKTFDEAMKSHNVSFWKEAINDEIDSIMGNNTWVLADLLPGCKLLGCKWIFKRKSKVDATIEKFEARLFKRRRFSMKDMGEVAVILGIRIKYKSNGIAISQSYYIEKVLEKFNYFECTRVSTPMDTSEKLMSNNGQVVSQLEHSRVIGCLMYVMTCTRPDIAFAVSKLSGYTSNPATQHWQAIQSALKYLKKTMDYRLIYTGYPSVLKGYTIASWINKLE
uniref:Zinc finger, CCHC-type n=1 Tax=Tanacetum cinerariifolium TaxID=118510 RepID=A0A699H1U5_TANCI|nr:zinc finger, CCHC-type [Tanacetum cinerariifolium]